MAIYNEYIVKQLYYKKIKHVPELETEAFNTACFVKAVGIVALGLLETTLR